MVGSAVGAVGAWLGAAVGASEQGPNSISRPPKLSHFVFDPRIHLPFPHRAHPTGQYRRAAQLPQKFQSDLVIGSPEESDTPFVQTSPFKLFGLQGMVGGEVGGGVAPVFKAHLKPVRFESNEHCGALRHACFCFHLQRLSS